MLYSKYDTDIPSSSPESFDITETEVRNATQRSAIEPHGWEDLGYIPQRDGQIELDRCLNGFGSYTLVDDGGVLWSERPAQYLSDSDCNNLKRDQYKEQIVLQTNTTANAATLINDPDIAVDITREQAAANDKLTELDNTSDEELDNFDPTIEVWEPQNNAGNGGYAQLTLSIVDVDPWVARPDDTVGWRLSMIVPKESIDEASEARVSILESPAGIDGPLPLTQDDIDPQKWEVEARDGEKWNGDIGQVRAELRWGSGSLPVGRVLISKKLYERDSGMFRYGLPPRSRRGSKRNETKRNS